ncbi:MAG: FAD-binding oxidoreductase [Pseudonocardia sp.]
MDERTDMTAAIGEGVEQLRAAMAGPVFVPDDSGYDDARRLWNGEIDHRPAVVARCTSPADVAAAVRYAGAAGLTVGVRGGGHGYAGAAAPEGGLMVDLSALAAVTVDPVARRARVGGGATLADLDAATQEHGLAVTGGTVSHTGVGGLTLGGGFGWLTPQFGLSCDNVVSAEVVLADGRVVRAGADDHPDLYWALRGGGGNFGVVTEFEFALHEVGPIVHAGLLLFAMDRAEEIARLGRDVVLGLPREFGAAIVGMNAPPAPFVPAELHFAPVLGTVVFGFGTAEEHARAIAPLQAAGPLVEMVSPLPYVAVQQMLDPGVPHGVHAYGRALFADAISDDAADVFVARVRAKRSPMSQMLLFRLGDGYRAVGDDDSAFGARRSAGWVVVMDAFGADAAMLAPDRAWVRDSWDAMRPFVASGAEYVNLMGEYDERRIRETYGTKYERLARIKGDYDPGNVFRNNANIKPS